MEINKDTVQRIPYKILSAMPAHIQYTGNLIYCDVETEHTETDTSFIQKPRVRRHSSPMPLRELRPAFMNIHSETDAITFLHICGPFRAAVYRTTMTEIVGWQTFFRHWMLEGSRPDGCKGPMLWPPVDDMESQEDSRIGGDISWSIFTPIDSNRVEAFVDCDSALEVIGATINLDLLEGARFEACGWCKSLFEITKDNGRLYCRQECAHRAGQKRRRAEAKTQKTLAVPAVKKRKSKGKR